MLADLFDYRVNHSQLKTDLWSGLPVHEIWNKLAYIA